MNEAVYILSYKKSTQTLAVIISLVNADEDITENQFGAWGWLHVALFHITHFHVGSDYVLIVWNNQLATLKLDD